MVVMDWNPHQLLHSPGNTLVCVATGLDEYALLFLEANLVQHQSRRKAIHHLIWEHVGSKLKSMGEVHNVFDMAYLVSYFNPE